MRGYRGREKPLPEKLSSRNIDIQVPSVDHTRWTIDFKLRPHQHRVCRSRDPDVHRHPHLVYKPSGRLKYRYPIVPDDGDGAVRSARDGSGSVLELPRTSASTSEDIRLLTAAIDAVNLRFVIVEDARRCLGSECDVPVHGQRGLGRHDRSQANRSRFGPIYRVTRRHGESDQGQRNHPPASAHNGGLRRPQLERSWRAANPTARQFWMVPRAHSHAMRWLLQLYHAQKVTHVI